MRMMIPDKSDHREDSCMTVLLKILLPTVRRICMICASDVYKIFCFLMDWNKQMETTRSIFFLTFLLFVFLFFPFDIFKAAVISILTK